jgi:hypothetical protein
VQVFVEHALAYLLRQAPRLVRIVGGYFCLKTMSPLLILRISDIILLRRSLLIIRICPEYTNKANK